MATWEYDPTCYEVVRVVSPEPEPAPVVVADNDPLVLFLRETVARTFTERPSRGPRLVQVLDRHDTPWWFEDEEQKLRDYLRQERDAAATNMAARSVRVIDAEGPPPLIRSWQTFTDMDEIPEMVSPQEWQQLQFKKRPKHLFA